MPTAADAGAEDVETGVLAPGHDCARGSARGPWRARGSGLRDRLRRGDDGAEDERPDRGRGHGPKGRAPLDELEENDDVKAVGSNSDIPERVLEAVAG